MPQPTMSQMHVSQPLRDFSVLAASKDEDFICRQCQKFLEVEKQTNKYYEYNTSDWNRIEVKPRGSAQESEGSGWSLSTTEYNCIREAVHKDFDWADMDEADDVINCDEDGAAWIAHQQAMHLDSKLNSIVMQPATWTTDYDGVASGPSTNEILQWDVSGSDPQADYLTLASSVHGYCGHDPNVMIIGYDVATALITNSVVRAAIQYTEPTLVRIVAEKLAAFFGVEKLFVGRAMYESAAEGASSSLATIIGTKDVWAGYVDPAPKKRSMSAWKVMAWKHGGKASQGMITRKMDDEFRTMTRYEAEFFLDLKVIAAGAGFFVDDCVG